MSELTKEYFDQGINEVNKSIEELAVAVKKGFDEVDNRFEKVDERFDSVESKLTVVQNKLDQALYHDLEIHERWIKQIADKVGLVLQV